MWWHGSFYGLIVKTSSETEGFVRVESFFAPFRLLFHTYLHEGTLHWGEVGEVFLGLRAILALFFAGGGWVLFLLQILDIGTEELGVIVCVIIFGFIVFIISW